MLEKSAISKIFSNLEKSRSLKMLFALCSGIIFSIGLVLSGMTNPAKVVGFLDIFEQFGPWDFSLFFVLGGAVGFNLISFKLIIKKKPICATKHFLPSTSLVDTNLIIGSALFGIGWGMLGICPGPGLVNLMTLKPFAFIFVASMLVGMSLFQFSTPISRLNRPGAIILLSLAVYSLSK